MNSAWVATLKNTRSPRFKSMKSMCLRKEEGGMKSRSICASTIDQRIHTSIDTNMLCLAMP